MSSDAHLSHDYSALKEALEGELQVDNLYRALYATDASIYRHRPQGVIFPKGEKDLVTIVRYAQQHKLSIIPRAAGTSLAGQCVGEGLIVDVSKYMTKIIELNVAEKWVRVQPGVIRDELNAFLAPHELHFGPNTSTANRCMIGGMVGNNSCGSSSIVYGSTRDHTKVLRTVLSDGSVHTFSQMSTNQLSQTVHSKDNTAKIYKQMLELLADPKNQKLIHDNFPKPSIKRRNTGYAIDLLANSLSKGEHFNMCDLLCGSEGTLALTSEITLHLSDLPPTYYNVVCAHFTTVEDSMKATQVAMQHQPHACELMDKIILDCTAGNSLYNRYRWWVEGDPKTVLMIEIRAKSRAALKAKNKSLIDDLNSTTSTYAIPIIPQEKCKEVWQLRKAGLGLLANLPGEARAVACIEDTAVALEDLPAYIKDFEANMVEYGQQPIYYAHAGDGEIHLRPVLDLKQTEDRTKLYDISKSTAELVKKYRGSLSGEHGDGRVRAPFIPLVMGDEVYELLRQVKQIWDPANIFNPGKIVDVPPLLEDLRQEEEEIRKDVSTAFRFENTGGLIGAIEACNGSGDCRKLPLSGGTMCPSYQATKNEKDTTRGRANALREFLQKHPDDLSFDHPELKEVMDLCLSCKGCTSECPSNVDMSKIKAEYLYQLHKEKSIPLRSKMIAENYAMLKVASHVPQLTNFMFRNSLTSNLLKRVLNISTKRDIPLLANTSLRRWYKNNYKAPSEIRKSVYLFCDEFTDLLDTDIGISAIKLLTALGYDVLMTDHYESGRAHISKGLLDKAKILATKNVQVFEHLVSHDIPLIGIEPSAILSFRDEYLSLVDETLRPQAQALSKVTFTIEEFLMNEINNGSIDANMFDNTPRQILLHAHCHQKAIGSVDSTAHLLGLPDGHSVEVIPSGCCGMAGSFGYDRDHYDVSMQIGELVLFPAVKSANQEQLIVAPGTSCRHQIKDGTNRDALHPVEILLSAVRSKG